jgi:uncharacterized damage-inducible protein DinB
MIRPTPWIERKFEFNFPPGLFPIIIERLRASIPRLKSMVKDVDEKKLEAKNNDKWSVKEVIGHLCDLEELWMGRINDFLDNKEELRAADMTNKKTHEAGHNNKPVIRLITQFAEARMRLIHCVCEFDETVVTRTALHPRLKQPMRLIDSLFFVAEHDDHELTKIRSLLNPVNCD